MKHNPCQCNSPTKSCPRYGWMKGRRYQVCHDNVVNEIERDVLLDAWSGVQEPGLAQKAINLAGSMLKHAINGFEAVTKESYEARLKICDSCDYCKKEGEEWTCLSCGCLVKIAASMSTKDCPLKKWPLPIVSNNTVTKSCNCG